LFLDEVDGMSARGDRGGFAALLSLLKNPTVPIVLAANAEVGEQIKELKRVTTIIKFKRIAPRLLILYLDHVLKMENAKVSVGDKIRLVSVSNGDMRTLLNEAQSLATAGFSEGLHPVNFSIDIDKAVTDFSLHLKLKTLWTYLLEAKASTTILGLLATIRKRGEPINLQHCFPA